MFAFEITTEKYDVDLAELAGRRLLTYPNAFTVLPADGGARVTIEGDDAMQLAAAATAAILLKDLIYFELAGMADALPLELNDKQHVLTEALRAARDGAHERSTRGQLMDYYSEYASLNLEGFLQFRMRRQRDEWQEIVDRIAEERLMSREYAELLGVLGAFASMQQPRMEEISICINPDGSCTLTDDTNARIEYVDCSEDGIVGLLVSMAPAKLTVYDLSNGHGQKIADAIARVFSGRVRVYR